MLHESQVYIKSRKLKKNITVCMHTYMHNTNILHTYRVPSRTLATMVHCGLLQQTSTWSESESECRILVSLINILNSSRRLNLV